MWHLIALALVFGLLVCAGALGLAAIYPRWDREDLDPDDGCDGETDSAWSRKP
jgi:hypothetical protein